MVTCSACGAALETPLGCGACGVLRSLPPGTGPFEVFGLAPAWQLDREGLRRALLRLSRMVHPDYHSADEAQRALAERNSAELNRAFAQLSEDYARGDQLVRMSGGPQESEQRSMPAPFLMEVLEWNEVLEEARAAPPGAPARAALDRLEPELVARRAETLQALARLLEPLPQPRSPALEDARRELNALRYLDKTLAELAALRVEQATSR